MKPKKIALLSSKPVFIISLIVIVVTVLIVFVTGLNVHRSIINNSVISLIILSFSFFTFIASGLYFGVKLKDTVGNIGNKIYANTEVSGNIPDLSSGSGDTNIDLPDADGIEGIIVAILLWLLITVGITLLIIFFDTIVITMLMAFLGMLYWIFFRALRLVFKNSVKCKGDLIKSVSIAIEYTILYTFWIYGIVMVADLLRKIL